MLSETAIINEHADWLQRKMPMSLDFASRKKTRLDIQKPKYWWNEKIASFQASYVVVRRVVTRIEKYKQTG